MLKQTFTLLACGMMASGASAAATVGFTSITNNDLYDAAIGEAQFTIEVKDAGPGSVEFLFTNVGPDASSMVQIYWGDVTNVLGSLDSWSSTTGGVDFTDLSAARPGNLPGPSAQSFIDDFSVQPDGKNRKTRNGVGAGEDVSFFFSTNKSYGDVIDALVSGDLKVGVHAKGFSSGGSESYTTSGGALALTGAPTPTAALAGLAMLGVVGIRRRRA